MRAGPEGAESHSEAATVERVAGVFNGHLVAGVG